MTDQKPAKLVEDGVSPYLQQPLRSFDQARQDRKRQQRQTAETDRPSTIELYGGYAPAQRASPHHQSVAHTHG